MAISVEFYESEELKKPTSPVCVGIYNLFYQSTYIANPLGLREENDAKMKCPSLSI